MQGNICTDTLASVDTMLARMTELVEHGSNGHTSILDLSMLDSIEDKLHLLSTRMRTLRNSLSAINRLPAEILVAIFHRAACSNTSRRSAQARLLVSITHVCHHWRDLCLANPLLWVRISTDPWKYEALNRLFLQRSCGAPLDVRLDGHSVHSDSIHSLVTSESQTARIARIEVRGSLPAEDLRHPAPLLEELVIHWKMCHAGTTLPVLFAGVTPRLVRLTLCRFTLPSAGQFSGLQELVLYGQRYQTNEELRSLTALLQASPTLQSLSFQSVVFSWFTPNPTDQRAALPRLQRLVCGSCSLDDAITILSILKLPSETAVLLDIDVSQGTYNTTRISSLLLHAESITKVCIAVYPRVSIISGTGPFSSFCFTLCGMHAEYARHDIVNAICEALPMERIEELRLLGDVSRVSELWRRSLDRLSVISKIVLENRSPFPSEFLRSLLSVVPDCAPPCPRLVDIGLVDFTWSALEPMCSVLSHRKRLGLPVRTITLYSYDASLSEVRSWRERAKSLQHLIDTLVFEKCDSPPALDLPETCQPRPTDHGHFD